MSPELGTNINELGGRKYGKIFNFKNITDTPKNKNVLGIYKVLYLNYNLLIINYCS